MTDKKPDCPEDGESAEDVYIPKVGETKVDIRPRPPVEKHRTIHKRRPLPPVPDARPRKDKKDEETD